MKMSKFVSFVYMALYSAFCFSNEEYAKYGQLDPSKKYRLLILSSYDFETNKKIYHEVKFYDNEQLQGEPGFVLNKEGFFEKEKKICHYAITANSKGVSIKEIEVAEVYHSGTTGIFCKEEMPFQNSRSLSLDIVFFVEVIEKSDKLIKVKIRGKEYFAEVKEPAQRK